MRWEMRAHLLCHVHKSCFVHLIFFLSHFTFHPLICMYIFGEYMSCNILSHANSFPSRWKTRIICRVCDQTLRDAKEYVRRAYNVDLLGDSTNSIGRHNTLNSLAVCIEKTVRDERYISYVMHFQTRLTSIMVLI